MCETCKQGVECALHPLWLMDDQQLVDAILWRAGRLALSQ